MLTGRHRFRKWSEGSGRRFAFDNPVGFSEEICAIWQTISFVAWVSAKTTPGNTVLLCQLFGTTVELLIFSQNSKRIAPPPPSSTALSDWTTCRALKFGMVVCFPTAFLSDPNSRHTFFSQTSAFTEYRELWLPRKKKKKKSESVWLKHSSLHHYSQETCPNFLRRNWKLSSNLFNMSTKSALRSGTSIVFSFGLPSPMVYKKPSDATGLKILLDFLLSAHASFLIKAPSCWLGHGQSQRCFTLTLQTDRYWVLVWSCS